VGDFVVSGRLTADASSLMTEAGKGQRAVGQLKDEIRQAGASARDAASGATTLTSAYGRTSAAAINAALGIDKIGRATADRASDIQAYGRGLDELRARYNPLFAVQQRFEAEMVQLSQAYRVGALNSEEYSAAMQRLQGALRLQTAEVQRVGRALAAGRPHYAGFGNAAQQAGYQVGDFFVQIESGTPILRAGIQQGTQFISMFGPWGAVIGAGVAVVGSLASILLATGEEAKKSEKDLWSYADAVEAIIERIEKSRLQSLSPVGQILAIGKSDLQEMERQLAEALAKRAQILAAVQPDLSQGRSPFQSDNPELQAQLDAAARLSQRQMQAASNPELDALNQQIADLTGRIEELRNSEITNAFADLRKELDPVAAAWTQYREQIELINDAVKRGVPDAVEYEAALKAAASADLQDTLAKASRSQPSDFERAVASITKQTDALLAQNAVYDDGARAREQAAAQQDLFSAAAEAGIPITTALMEQIFGLSAAYAEAAVTADQKRQAERDAAKAAEDAARDHAKAVDQIRDAQLAMLPAYEQAVMKANQWRDAALKGLDATKAGYAGFAAEVERIFTQQLEQARQIDLRSSRDWQDGITRGLKDISDEAGDMAGLTERALKNFAKAGEDAFVGLVRQTKSFGEAFGDLIDGLLNDILRLYYQRQIAGPIADMLGGIDWGGLFGFGGQTVTAEPTVVTPVATLHDGGIAGRDRSDTRFVDPGLFGAAPRYHEGGIAGLRPGEVAAVLKDGEEVVTPEDPRHRRNIGRAGSAGAGWNGAGAVLLQPAFNVSLINRSGVTMQEPEVQARANGNGGLDVDLYLDRAVEQSLKSGRGAAVLRQDYNAARQLTARG